MAEFPLDVISEILLLLPVNTLLRFKCVSKTFFSIIDGRDFINLHLNTNSELKAHRKIVFQDYLRAVLAHVLDIDGPVQPLPDFLLKPPQTNDDRDSEDAGYESEDSSDGTSHTDEDLASKASSYQFSPYDEGNGVGISCTDKDSGTEDSNNEVSGALHYPLFAHCNGLVLIGERYMSWFGVWNPSTRKYWKFEYNRNARVVSCSFGYEPSTDDYKVLLVHRVHACPFCDYCGDNTLPEFWILGLRSGSWKKIERNYPYFWSDDWDATYVCFLDGAFYFRSNFLTIHAINVLEEVFFPVSIPNPFKGYYFVWSVQVLEGCLCVGFGRWGKNDDDDEEEEEEGAEVLYVRKTNDEGEFFWTKLLSFTCEEHSSYHAMGSITRDRRLEYSKTRDKMFILYCSDECKLYIYDFEEKSTKRIVDGYVKYPVKVIFCVESLVCLDYLMRKEEDDDESKLDQV